MRRIALVAGVLYLITFLTSIPTLKLYEPLRNHAGFVLGAGDATTVTAGALLEAALALTCAATAVVLFPVVTRYSRTAALGYLAARLLEAGLILVGVISVLSVLDLRHRVAGTRGGDPASLVTAGRALAAVYDGTFLLGQSLMPVVCAVSLGSVLYRSRLVPRVIPAIGLVGAPLLLASDIAIFCGILPQRGALAALLALPIAAWELALGIWLVARGFRCGPQVAQPESDVAAVAPAGALPQPALR